MEMESIGQSNSIYIYTKKEVWGSFTVVQKTNLDKQSAPCVMDPNYSYTRCMLNHLATTAGCYLDWVNPGAVNVSNSDPLYTFWVLRDMSIMIISGVQIDDHRACVTWDQVLRYHEALNTVRKLSWTQMVNVTGCLAKCSYREFRFEKVCNIIRPLVACMHWNQHFIYLD